MLLRPRFHWLTLGLGVFYLAIATFAYVEKPDYSISPFLIILGVLTLATWAGTFDVLTDDSIERRKLFFVYRIAYSNIASVTPHKKDQKWSYGRVFVVIDKAGRRYTFQPRHGDDFLAILQNHVAVLCPLAADELQAQRVETI